MRTKGKITSWNDEKGYGFISPMAGRNRVFVHIKGFDNRGRRPAVGDVVTYSTSADARGRPYAEGVTIAGVKLPKKPASSSKLASHVIAVCCGPVRPDHNKAEADCIPVVKLFTPDGGCTLLLSQRDPEEPDIAFGLCDLGMGCPELGSVRISEPESARGRLGLPVERDHYFAPV